MMIGKELTESQYEKIDASGAEVVAELDHVDYNKASKHSGLNDLSLKIHAGEIVGRRGVDGNGRRSWHNSSPAFLRRTQVRSISRESVSQSSIPTALSNTAFAMCRRTGTCRV